MADKSSKPVVNEIRIIKRKGGHGGHHGGAWKVAYADFVTAMMAFFLVMWICGLSQTIKEAVAGYFKDPVAFMDAVRQGKAPFQAPGVNAGTGRNAPDNMGTAASERAGLQKAKESIEKMITASPEFKNLKNSIDIQICKEGLKIELIDGQENLFFDSGSAKVKPATDHLLRAIATELGKLQNKVIIEGHTDIRPLGRPGYTNWELSAGRANAARTIMEGGGLTANQVDQVRGYAATHPRNPDPYHYSNRRVSIIVALNHPVAADSAEAGSQEDSAKAGKEGGQVKPPEINVGPH